MVEILTYALTIGALGYLIPNALTHPGEVLAWLPPLVQKVTGTTGKPVREWNGVQWWAAKITYNCGKCIAGNLTIVFCLIHKVSFGGCFVAVVAAVFFAYVLQRVFP